MQAARHHQTNRYERDDLLVLLDLDLVLRSYVVDLCSTRTGIANYTGTFASIYILFVKCSRNS